MLTDYHLHLRPDEDGTTAERYFTAENVDRYLAAADEAGIEELGVSEHVHRFTQALELWRHPFWREQAVDDLDAYCEFVRGTALRLGIECDFVPGAEDRTADAARGARLRLRRRLGPLHRRGDAVDHEGFDVWEGNGDPDGSGAATSRRSPSAPARACSTSSPTPTWSRSGAAPGRCPTRDPRAYYEPAVEAIAETGIAVEVSTAGLRKPVGELYPSPAFAEMCVEAGAAFALSSDAHLPEQVGFGYDRAVEFLDGLGVGEICVFEHRRRRLEPVG